MTERFTLDNEPGFDELTEVTLKALGERAKEEANFVHLNRSDLFLIYLTPTM